MHLRPRSSLLVSSLFLAEVLGAQTRAPKAFEFSIPNIMRGPEIYGREPQRVQWSADGRWLYFQWNPPGTDWREPAHLYRVRASGGSAPERVPDTQLDSVSALLETGDVARDRRSRVVSAQGDLYYKPPYTARILNQPQDDSLAYRRSSPIYFAQGLEDPLLMAHGMVDINVDFQDIVRLTQRLIELGKTNWELAPYPAEDHEFVRPSSWADEYRRIFELFEAHLAKRGPAAANVGEHK